MSITNTYAARLAPFFMARINPMSTGVIEPLILHQTLEALSTIKMLQERLMMTGNTLEKPLFALVARLETEHELRRGVLALKRDLFNQRAPKISAEQMKVIQTMLDKETNGLLAEWFDLWDQCEGLLEESRTIFQQETAFSSRYLNTCLENPELQKGIALASPEFMKSLSQYCAGKDQMWFPGESLSKSAVSYLTRAAVKTSPFSTFSQIALINNSDGLTTGQEKVRGGSYIRLLQPIIHLWFRRIMQDRDLGRAVKFYYNETHFFDGENYNVMDSYYFIQDTVPLKKEKMNSVVLSPSVMNKLEELKYGSQVEWLNHLRQDGGDEVFEELVRLNLLIPLSPYKSSDEYPLKGLIEILQQASGTNRQPLIDKLAAIESIVYRLKSCDAHQRIIYLQMLKTGVESTFILLGLSVPDWLEKVSLVYEDCKAEEAPVSYSSILDSDLCQVGEWLKDTMFISGVYDYLLNKFVEMYGAGGRCFNIPEFLHKIIQRDTFAEELKLIQEADRSLTRKEAVRRRRRLGNGSTASPTRGILFQTISQSREQFEAGDYLLVLNGLPSGTGNLMSRFIPLFKDDTTTMSEYLQLWLQQVYGNENIMAVVYGADWNNMQMFYPDTGRVLYWPGETLQADVKNTRINLDKLSIKHNPGDNTLAVEDEQANLVAPVYMGTAAKKHLPISLQLFLAITDPWLQAAEEGSTGSVLNSGIVYSKREVLGKVVVRREQWIITGGAFPVRKANESHYDYYSRLQRWRMDNNLPEEAFVTVKKKQGTAVSKISKNTITEKKPFYVHFGSPHCLEAMQKMVRGDESVIILTEMLPGRQEHLSHSGSHATELMGLMRWGESGL